MKEDIFWLGFSAFPGVGPLRFQSLLHQFGTAQDAWNADEKDLLHALGCALTAKFLPFRDSFSLAEYQQKLIDKKISFLLSKDKNYPQLLQYIPNAPFVLYCKGSIEVVSQLSSDSSRSIAIVGTRKITAYGREVTELLTKQLVGQGFVIISGLAFGVDAIAHDATIEAGGKTVAVLGCGVDCCSPGANRPLYDKIMGRFGAIVSESAFEAGVFKGMFPARNRIIAGLSLGVVVTEGTEDSGALITAQRALEAGRPVFAVPGPITSTLSKGPLALLQKGASLVQNAEDVLSGLHLEGYAQPNPAKMMHSDIPEEQQILDVLQKTSLTVDELVRMLGKHTDQITALMSMMELKGMIKNKGGKFYLG